MTPGRLFYLAYHRPRERLEEALDAALFERRDRAMRAAAANLDPVNALPATHLAPVRFLTGERFAHQTIFCARSLCETMELCPPFEFFDDGSLTAWHSALLLRLFPGSTVVSASESFAAVERRLPVNRFPSLRRARDYSPLMRKLLDLRVGREKPALYLDSDMLFFSRPHELAEWLRAPSGALHMTEPGPGAYVDAPAILESLLGRPIPAGVNTGIVGLDDHLIDWPALERTATALGDDRLTHKWAEQTLFAWLLGGLHAQPLDKNRYRVCSSRADLAFPAPVLRHYTHKSKMPYLAGEWRHRPMCA